MKTIKHTKGKWSWSLNRLCGEFGQVICTVPDAPERSEECHSGNEQLLRGASAMYQSLCLIAENGDAKSKETALYALKRLTNPNA